MTNIEKVKRILDAGHWVKVTFEDGDFAGDILTVTSYSTDSFSYIKGSGEYIYTHIRPTWEDCTIEVIQRIPTAYKAGDKVLVLSNPEPVIKSMQAMVGKVGKIKRTDGYNYSVYNEDKSDYFVFPSYCLAPVFDEDSLSGKEMKIVIDGKEYTATLKLI